MTPIEFLSLTAQRLTDALKEEVDANAAYTDAQRDRMHALSDNYKSTIATFAGTRDDAATERAISRRLAWTYSASHRAITRLHEASDRVREAEINYHNAMAAMPEPK